MSLEVERRVAAFLGVLAVINFHEGYGLDWPLLQGACRPTLKKSDIHVIKSLLLIQEGH
jgi:hypothetical protein